MNWNETVHVVLSDDSPLTSTERIEMTFRDAVKAMRSMRGIKRIRDLSRDGVLITEVEYDSILVGAKVTLYARPFPVPAEQQETSRRYRYAHDHYQLTHDEDCYACLVWGRVADRKGVHPDILANRES